MIAEYVSAISGGIDPSEDISWKGSVPALPNSLLKNLWKRLAMIESQIYLSELYGIELSLSLPPLNFLGPGRSATMELPLRRSVRGSVRLLSTSVAVYPERSEGFALLYCNNSTQHFCRSLPRVSEGFCSFLHELPCSSRRGINSSNFLRL